MANPLRPVADPRACLSKQSAADELGVSERTLERMVKDGSGPPLLRLGSRIVFPRAALLDWIESNTTKEGGRGCNRAGSGKAET